MKPSEFYEKYWMIDYGDGKKVHPPKLSDAEKGFLDNVSTREDVQGVYFSRKRRRAVQINIPMFIEEMNKHLPPFLIPPEEK